MQNIVFGKSQTSPKEVILSEIKMIIYFYDGFYILILNVDIQQNSIFFTEQMSLFATITEYQSLIHS